MHGDSLQGARSLGLVLFVPRMNKALRDEIACLGCWLDETGQGYARLQGPLLYDTHIVFMDDVAEAERDEYLDLFTSRPTPGDTEATDWLRQWFLGRTVMQDVRKYEDYKEMRDKIFALYTLEEYLARIPLETRVAGLSPEQRLAGLATVDLVPALPGEILRSLSDEYLTSLPANVRTAVMRKLAREEE